MRPSFPSSMSCLTMVTAGTRREVYQTLFGTPAAPTPGGNAPPPPAVRPAGFSPHTLFPALPPGVPVVVVRVVRARDVDDVDVLPGDQVAPVGGVRLVSPVLGEFLHALFVPRRDRLQHRLARQVEEPRRLQERIRMRASHEPVADQTDIQGFHCSPTPKHPRR